MIKKRFGIGLLFLLPFVVFAQPVKVSTSITADTIIIGDQVRLQIEIEKDVSQEVGLPQFENGKMTEQIEVLGQPTVDTISVDGRRVKLRINYTITSFEAGSYVLQGFPLVLIDGKGNEDTLKTPTVNTLTVTTFEIDTAKQEIYDIKPPLDTPFEWAEVWAFVGQHKLMFALIGVGVLLLAAAIYFWLRFRARRKQAAARAAEPPHIVAIRSLEELRGKKLWQNGRVHEYYSTLSDIIRVYIDGRYGIGAMEMTTPEIIQAMLSTCDEKQLAELREFFMLADLVKFAKWTPDSIENEDSFNEAYHFVEQTKILLTTTTSPDINPQTETQS